MEQATLPSNLGTVETRSHSFDRLLLASGQELGPVTLAYQTYGRLDEKGGNAVLLLHALTGDANVAGLVAGNKSQAGGIPWSGRGRRSTRTSTSLSVAT